MLLTENEIQTHLSDLKEWTYVGGKIQKEITMHNWKGVMLLTNAIAHIAETAWHHPELHLSFSTIKILLETHDEGGITNKDIAMAKKIDELLSWNPKEDDGPLEGIPDTVEFHYLKKD